MRYGARVINRNHVCALAATASLAAAGCGSGSPSSSTGDAGFRSGLATSQQDFRKLGTDLAHDITAAGSKTDAELAQEFGGLATRADQQASALAALQPPPRYRKRVAALVAGFHAVKTDLTDIATAATKHSASRAEAATRALLSDAAKIKAADVSLSKALGLPPVTGTSKSSTTSASSSH